MVGIVRTIAVALSFIIVTGGGVYAAGAGAGKRIFQKKGCASCHITKRPETPPSYEQFLKWRGPALWYAGSKFKEDWLRAWLESPEPIRPMAYHSLTERNRADHPALSPKEAAAVAKYLLTLKSNRVKKGIIKPKKTVRGRIIFEKKLGCYGCHLVKKGKRKVGGLSGPSLVGAGRRLNPDWIYAFLNDQKYFVPHTSMPIYRGLVTDMEMRILSGYVAAME